MFNTSVMVGRGIFLFSDVCISMDMEMHGQSLKLESGFGL